MRLPFAFALGKLGLTKAEFARLAGVHPTTVSRWQTTSAVPPWAYLLVAAWQHAPEALAAARGCATDDANRAR